MWNTRFWGSRSWKRNSISEFVLLSSLLSPEAGLERALHGGGREGELLSTDIPSESLSSPAPALPCPAATSQLSSLRKPDVRPQSRQDFTEEPIYTSLCLKFLPNPPLSAKCRRVENLAQMLFICQTFWCKVCPMVVEPPLLIKTFHATINLSCRS